MNPVFLCIALQRARREFRKADRHPQPNKRGVLRAYWKQQAAKIVEQLKEARS